MQRPTFNVTEFQDVVNVQMNDAMRHMLIEFINEVDQNELEAELRAFRNALRDPEGALERKFRSGTGTTRRYRDNYPQRRHAGGYGGDRENYQGPYTDSPDSRYRKPDEHYGHEEEQA